MGDSSTGLRATLPASSTKRYRGVGFIQKLSPQVSKAGERPCLLAVSGRLMPPKSLGNVIPTTGTCSHVLQNQTPFAPSLLGLPLQRSPFERKETARGRGALEPARWRCYWWHVFSRLMAVKATHEMSWGMELTTSLPRVSGTAGFRRPPSQCPRERGTPERHQPSYSSRTATSEPPYDHCNLLLCREHGKRWCWEAVIL